MVWASAHTGLPIPDVEPKIVFKEHCQLYEILQQECPEDRSFGPQALHSAGVIFLPSHWNSHEPYHLAMLLHELVHVMQFHAGVEPVPCHAVALERPAWEAHIAFLESMGLDGMEVSRVNPLMYFLLTNCADGR
jgi:hypothetical protein